MRNEIQTHEYVVKYRELYQALRPIYSPAIGEKGRHYFQSIMKY